MNLFLFLGIIFLIILFLGIFLEKIKIPWIFAALILGLFLSLNNPFFQITNSSVFKFLANLGMYFLLFLIGFEFELTKLKKLSSFIIKSTFIIILFEAFLGSLLVHFVFHYSYLVSILTAISFATVGEVVLIPILDEFRLTKTKLGQSILAIGVFDDLIEVLLIVVIVVVLPFLVLNNNSADLHFEKIILLFSILIVFFILVFLLFKLKKREYLMKFPKIESIFFLTLAIFFIFLGVGIWAKSDLGTLGALLAGIGIKNFLPRKRIKFIESEIKLLAYSFFGPIFFLWAGLSVDFKYLLKAPLFILLIIITSSVGKVLPSYFIGKKELGTRQSIVLGISLAVRFSTSIVIIKILFENQVLGNKLYSVLIASAIIFQFIIPFLLSFFIKKWKISGNLEIKND